MLEERRFVHFETGICQGNVSFEIKYTLVRNTSLQQMIIKCDDKSLGLFKNVIPYDF